MSKRNDLLRHFTGGSVEVDTIGVLEGNNFKTVWVARVGQRVLATTGEDFRHPTAEAAREYGERVQKAMRAALTEATP